MVQIRRIPPLPDFTAGYDFARAYLVDSAKTEDEAGGRVGLSNFRMVYELYHWRDSTHAAVLTAGGWRQWRLEHRGVLASVLPPPTAENRCSRRSTTAAARPGTGEWAVEKRIPLPEAIRGLPGYEPSLSGLWLKVVTTGPGFVVMSPQPETAEQAKDWKWFFAVDLETMEVERVAADMGRMRIFRRRLPELALA
ncbi:hypothetical protein E2562_022366 [Oryza meyeriana var. granulata]|uniref:DUF1618 domain-containing protein n=1 Tax=Oryza meyeriana var. granulata TaxID=110450 RepID=A0A6G1DN02_9ORYZ|nr:hypothetical protein E2562_022366 [Oryza meyeriana var. granulata]